MTRASRLLRKIAIREVTKAIKNGFLKRPKKCTKCKLFKYVEGHHENYKYPLKVVWLCKKCHVDRHKNLGSYKKNKEKSMDSKNLKALRLKVKPHLTRKATVEALKKKGLSITEQTLQNWENGVYVPSLTDAVKLSEVYGVTLEAVAG